MLFPKNISASEKELLNQHVIVISKSGKGKDPVSLKNIRSDSLFREKIKFIVANIEQKVANNEVDRVVIFLHGGLTNYRKTRKRALELTDAMLTDRVYPIFVSWNSGTGSSYLEHLVLIRQGQKSLIFGLLSSPLVLTSDAASGLAMSPLSMFSTIKNDLTTIASDYPSIADKCSHSIATVYNKQEYGKNPLKINEGTDKRTVGSKLLRGCMYTITFPFKVATEPILTAGGKPSWDIMLRRTQALYRKEAEFDIRHIRKDSAKVAKHLHETPTGALSVAIEELLKIQTLTDTIRNVEVDLVAHSMGAIIANQLLAKYTTFKFDNIVYMGAACSIKEFETMTVPYLMVNNRTKFFNLSLHPIAERRESNALDIVIRGSLLEWIDQLFTTPASLKERTMGKWTNLMQTAHIFPIEIRDQLFFRCFDVGVDKKAQPQKHGDFSDFSFWEKDFWWPEDIFGNNIIRLKSADRKAFRFVPKK